MESVLARLSPGRERAIVSMLQRLRSRKTDNETSAVGLVLELGSPAKLARRLRQKHVPKAVQVANLMWQTCVGFAEGWLVPGEDR